MTVLELSPEQRQELKSAYFWNEDPETQEYINAHGIADPDEIPDAVINEYFGGVCFVPDDFACTAWDGCGQIPHALPF